MGGPGSTWAIRASSPNNRRWALKHGSYRFKDNGKEWKKYEPAAKLDVEPSWVG